MKILLVNQCFHPDVVAVSQYLTDLAVELARKGHTVTVIASNRAYDDPRVKFPKREIWKEITIIRIPVLGWGRKSKWLRIADFASFFLYCFLQLLRLPDQDVVVAMTVPPLISILASSFVQLRGGRLVYWVMDMNPDEAIAAGWIKPDSFVAKFLEAVSRHTMSVAAQVVVLDRFMQQRLVAKGIKDDKIRVIRPWPLDRFVRFDPDGREEFRSKQGLNGQFVVMYSGNHSPCHPLDSLLYAAAALKDERDIVFYFIGGGSEFKKVQRFAAKRNLSNIFCLPYQPLDKLSASLSAADLHVVVMGDQFVGTVHPCKIYNVLAVGAKFLYIGPQQGHIPDLVAQHSKIAGTLTIHGDIDAIVRQILEESALVPAAVRANLVPDFFSQEVLLSNMIEAVEG